MIPENALAAICSARTLARAEQIAASDRNILTKQVRYDGDEITLSAFVASSSGWDDRYRTSVCFEDDSGIVLDYSCTCPADREHDGMCKHCAALMLSLIHISGATSSAPPPPAAPNHPSAAPTTSTAAMARATSGLLRANRLKARPACCFSDAMDSLPPFFYEREL